VQLVPHYAQVKDDGTGRIESVMSGDVNVEPAAALTVLTAKEKKQREKEAKAREKKEEAETKRRLKQQDKQLKEEAKKKTETPAERRRKRRQQNVTNSATRTGSSARGGKAGGRNFLSTQQPTPRTKNTTECQVRLLDGKTEKFEIEV